MPVVNRDGLVWDQSGFDTIPQWSREPSIDAIKAVCQEKLASYTQDGLDVSFLSEGALNKIYVVETKEPQQKFIMRVALPVDPRHKTRGEVSTLRWISQTLDLPVPKIIAFDDSSDNKIGYEWILMSFVSGKPVYYLWRKLSMKVKGKLVEQIAEAQARLLQHQFQGIGTLEVDGEDNAVKPRPGYLVAPEFFVGSCFEHDVPRGPFHSSFEWLSSYLDIIELEQQKALEEAEDEDETEEAEDIINVVSDLKNFLPKVFQRAPKEPEQTVLWHGDLNLNNIMVDEEGGLVGIIDWERTAALPIWSATRMPQFLECRGLEEETRREPKREDYADETLEEAEEDKERLGEDYLDSEGKTDLYWMHLMEYERTQLRKVYKDHIRQVWLSWDTETRDAAVKVDFLKAVGWCSVGVRLNGIEEWIEAIEDGQSVTLEDVALPKIPV